MSIQIALLRGINVGGKNIISMTELKAAFLKAGFDDAVTYINSGNVLFSSDKSAEQLKPICEGLIEKAFGLNISVVVISTAELAEAVESAPAWWGQNEDCKHNAIFVIPPSKAEQICEEVGEIKPEYERLFCGDKVIFWTAPAKDFSKTRWSKVPQSKAYLEITIRNSNTVRKLLALANSMAEGV